jgi:sialate O-acetylesterase
MAVAIDLGEANDIHPRNKIPVGQRLYLAAQKVAYHQDVVYSGPIYDTMLLEGSRIRIKFTSVGGGLVSKDGKPLKSFAIAEENRKFYWANAVIEGNDVIVSSPKLSKPVAVRYAWATNPDATLYNLEGLPASPFRTDTWKMDDSR